MMNWKQMWKEVVMACFKVLSYHMPGKNEEKQEKPHSGQSASRLRFELKTSQIWSTTTSSVTSSYEHNKLYADFFQFTTACMAKIENSYSFGWKIWREETIWKT